MPIRPALALTAGAVLTAALAVTGVRVTTPALLERFEQDAVAAIAAAGGTPVSPDFRGLGGLASRHPTLSGGEAMEDALREQIARAVAAVPGVGGVRWADSEMKAQGNEPVFAPLHCQDDVNALLKARSIRFDEGRSSIDAGSRQLLDEVAAALRPCLGSIIAITGHTNGTGNEAANLALSQERADAVLAALIARGIPDEGLRSVGVGSARPVIGLLPEDPANRRIEFSVVATVPLQPTPIDTPSAR